MTAPFVHLVHFTKRQDASRFQDPAFATNSRITIEQCAPSQLRQGQGRKQKKDFDHLSKFFLNLFTLPRPVGCHSAFLYADFRFSSKGRVLKNVDILPFSSTSTPEPTSGPSPTTLSRAAISQIFLFSHSQSNDVDERTPRHTRHLFILQKNKC